MALSVKQDFGHRRATILQPCCDYSRLVDAKTSTNRHKTQLLRISVGIVGSFFIAELATGLWSGSLALQADAGHMFSDVSALVLTLVASYFADRPASKRATFGHQRVEILAALANSIALIAIATVIIGEAFSHLRAPEAVMGLPMLVVAGVGLLVNSINIALLHKASRDDLNLRGAFLHMVADAASSVGVIVAALAIYFWHWMWVDAFISLLIACFVIGSAVPILQQSWEILMEYAPRFVEPSEVEAALASFPGVESVEKLRIWAIGSHQVALTAHLLVDIPSSDQRDRLLSKLQAHLNREFGITESTLQLKSPKTMEATAIHPLLNSNLIDLFARQHED